MAITDKGMTATGLIMRLKKEGDTEFKDVARVVDIQPPGSETESADVTNQSHTWRQKIASGIKDAGQANFLVNSLPEDYADAYAQVGLQVDAEIVLPDNPPVAIKFSGFILDFQPGGFSLGEKVDHTITIEVNGPVTTGAPTE